LPPEDVIALEPGQQGIQLEVLGEGRYFRNPYIWDWEIHPVTEVPAGKFAVLVRKYGKNQATGGIVANDEYRKTSIAMRKIMAKGVTWTMGSTSAESQRASDEATHKVTLDDNYYIGVFEVTQQQLALIKPGRQTGYFYTATDWQMRPCEQHSYIEIRDGDSQSTSVSSYPSAPASGSYLDLLRSKTGISFDLPSEAQWEFAARAGHGSGLYGDDSAILNKNNTSYNASNLDANLGRIARYKWNCTWGMSGADCGSTSARADVSTAICGSYAPND
jgi:formylglycine-generating enzyme required for sulfatase activity